MLKKKHHSIAYHRCQEAVSAGTFSIVKQGTKKNIFHKYIKYGQKDFILERFTY